MVVKKYPLYPFSEKQGARNSYVNTCKPQETQSSNIQLRKQRSADDLRLKHNSIMCQQSDRKSPHQFILTPRSAHLISFRLFLNSQLEAFEAKPEMEAANLLRIKALCVCSILAW